MNRNVILMVILIFALSSCNNAKNNSDKSTEQNIEMQDQSGNKDIVPEKDDTSEQPIIQKRDIKEDRMTAMKELKEKLANNPKYWEPLVLNYYTVDYISDGQGAPKDVLDIGEWYDFEKDFRYQHGFFNKLYEQGIYTFDIDNKLLLMIPEDNTKAPSEWKILDSGDIIVMVGTAKFGNNPIQKHCQNVKEKPELDK